MLPVQSNTLGLHMFGPALTSAISRLAGTSVMSGAGFNVTARSQGPLVQDRSRLVSCVANGNNLDRGLRQFTRVGLLTRHRIPQFGSDLLQGQGSDISLAVSLDDGQGAGARKIVFQPRHHHQLCTIILGVTNLDDSADRGG